MCVLVCVFSLLMGVLQFDALHTRGSSHGASRITRMAYDRHHYAEMMKEAFPMWDEIEKEYGQQIFV